MAHREDQSFRKHHDSIRNRKGSKDSNRAGHERQDTTISNGISTMLNKLTFGFFGPTEPDQT